MLQITIPKWDAYQPRKDVKKPTWFRFENTFIDSPQFFEFNNGEMLTWVYLMSMASRAHEGTFFASDEHAETVCRIKKKDFNSAVEKLQKLQIVRVSVHDKHASVQMEPATNERTDEHNEHNERTEQFAQTFRDYPIQIKGPGAEERFFEQIKTPQDFADIRKALMNYIDHLKRNTWKQPKQTFAAFLGTKKSGYFWRDFINGDPTQKIHDDPLDFSTEKAGA